MADREKTKEELIKEIELLQERIAEPEKLDAEHRRRKKTLSGQEKYFREFVENALDIIMILNENGSLRFINSSVERILGYRPNDVIGKSAFKFIHPDDLPNVMKHFTRALQNPAYTPTLELRVRSKDSSWHYLEGIGKNSLGHPVVAGIVISARDITKRKKAEEALQHSEEYFRAITENSSDIIIIVDKKGNITYVSPPIERFSGYKPEELIGKSAFEFIHPDDLPRAIDDFSKAIQTTDGTISNLFRVVHKDGSERILEGLGKNLFDNPVVKGFVMNVRDVTKRVKAERALRESEDKYRLITENTSDYISIMKFDGTFIYVSPSHKQLGHVPEDLLGKSGINMVHPEDKIKLLPLLKRYVQKEITELLRIAEKRESERISFRFPDKSGIWHYLEATANLIKNPAGGGYNILLISRDITEPKKAEEVLRASEKKYRTLIENVPQKIFLKDKNSVYISCNENYAANLKIKSDEIAGRTDYDFYPQELAEKYRADDKRIMEAGNTEDIEEKYIQNGQELIVHTVKTPVKDGNGNTIGILGIFWDVTERKKAEQALQDAYNKLKDAQEELIQSGKMAAMGQMAAGISHELNQPLTGIKGFTQAVLMDLDKDSPIRQDLNRIVEQADRMDKIIKNIRLFARKSEFKTEELDINKPIQDALMLLSQQLKLHNIRVNRALAKGLPKIKGDPNQLQQVFLNLITNARDAMDSLNSADAKELTIKACLSQDKKNIEITFQDTGCGISPKDLKNIFNPFFTTKSTAGDIGLGLSIAYRIIENHKGRIEVESQVGKGTTFRITLPIVKTKKWYHKFRK
jgi:PAS domain S-box-containing protein